ncbi:hypothetical protein ILYODFUR_011196 [Ilyodon furcidens]|uniref:Uncharacterized protein n=1 Tax=Ilyodon furcidens TaxID=33524 RepID=A0ABV0T740_9TELE
MIPLPLWGVEARSFPSGSPADQGPKKACTFEEKKKQIFFEPFSNNPTKKTENFEIRLCDSLQTHHYLFILSPHTCILSVTAQWWNTSMQRERETKHKNIQL